MKFKNFSAGEVVKMDRGKNLPPKSSKSKPLGFSGDFIALGPKQSRAEPTDVKKPQSSTSGVPSKPTPAAPSLGKNINKHAAMSTLFPYSNCYSCPLIYLAFYEDKFVQSDLMTKALCPTVSMFYLFKMYCLLCYNYVKGLKL